MNETAPPSGPVRIRPELSNAESIPWWKNPLFSLAWTVFLLGTFCLCLPIDFGIPMDLAIHGMFGWLIVLGQNAFQWRFDAATFAIAVVMLISGVALIHSLGRTWLEYRVSGRIWRWRWTLAIIFVPIIAFTAALSSAGAAARLAVLWNTPGPWLNLEGRGSYRSRSKNLLKEQALAFHNYHESFETFPPGGTFEEDGAGRHGWMTYLLPYVDQAPLYQTIDLSLPWDDPKNAKAFQKQILMYLNPKLSHLNEVERWGAAHYAANAWISGPNRGLKLKDITDGPSLTILAGEVREEIAPWGSPGNFRDPQLGINRVPNGFGSPFHEGCHFLIGDGAVRFVSEKIDAKVLKALSTPAGGEPVGDGW